MSWKNEKFKRAMESNNRYAAQITGLLGNVPKIILAELAGETLYAAMDTSTKHDSSRAAANWQIIKAGDPVPVVLDPYYYGEDGTGSKGDAGSMRDFAINYKMMVYGITTGQRHTAIPGGLLATKIGLGRAGAPPKLFLVNPIAADNQKRLDGAGHTYDYNAFGADWVEVNLPSIASRVGTNTLPKYFRYHLSGGVKA